MKNKFYTALVFGIASIPWTYLFALFQIPLWPSFIASASFFASGKKFFKSYLNNLIGIIYAALTLLFARDIFRSSVLWLSIIVGIFMFIGSLHYMLKLLSFLPAVFLGYATMFSINAAKATIGGVSGIFGQVLATATSMLIGSIIALMVHLAARRLSG